MTPLWNQRLVREPARPKWIPAEPRVSLPKCLDADRAVCVPASRTLGPPPACRTQPLVKPSPGPPVIGSRLPRGSGFHARHAEASPVRPRIITVIRPAHTHTHTNTHKHSHTHSPRKISLLLNRRSVLSWEQLVCDVSEALGFPRWDNGRVRRLFSLSTALTHTHTRTHAHTHTRRGVGVQEVRGLADFFRCGGDAFLAVGMTMPSLGSIAEALEELYPHSPGYRGDLLRLWQRMTRTHTHANGHAKADSGFHDDDEDDREVTTSPTNPAPKPPANNLQPIRARQGRRHHKAGGEGQSGERVRRRREEEEKEEAERERREEIKEAEREKIEEEEEEQQEEERKRREEQAPYCKSCRGGGKRGRGRGRSLPPIAQASSHPQHNRKRTENASRQLQEVSKLAVIQDSSSTPLQTEDVSERAGEAGSPQDVTPQDMTKQEVPELRDPGPKSDPDPNPNRNPNPDHDLPADLPADGGWVSLSELERFYELGQLLGDGNFAVVRECHVHNVGEAFAMKVVERTKLQGREHMIQNEVCLLRGLCHPRLVRLFRSHHTPLSVYLLMELVTGGDLFDALARRGSFNEWSAAGMLMDISQALEFIHTRSIAHRDIKPENLLVECDGRLKLADFGLAVVVSEPLFTVCGTPTYVAPEILAETGYGVCVDVWAMGVILYVLLCGFPPFRSEGRDQEELFRLIQTGVVHFLSPFWDHVSDGAKDLIRALLQVDPRVRLTAKQALQHSWLRERPEKDQTHTHTVGSERPETRERERPERPARPEREICNTRETRDQRERPATSERPETSTDQRDQRPAQTSETRDQRERPATPERPETRERPATPETRDQRERPATPERPETSTDQRPAQTSETIDQRERSATPETRDQIERPATPERPETRERPATPERETSRDQPQAHSTQTC